MARRIKVKPGKMGSRLGLVVGIAFVLIGLVVVIPTFGPFGILWTAVAGYIAFINYKNGFTDEGIPTHEIEIEDDGSRYSGETYNGGENLEEKLKTLESLYRQGLVTNEEYEQKRQELLDRF